MKMTLFCGRCNKPFVCEVRAGQVRFEQLCAACAEAQRPLKAA